MAGHVSPLRALARDADLRRAAGALALFGLAEYGPWVAMLVYAYGQGGATATGLVSLALLLPTALFAPCCGPLIDRFGASSVLFGAFAGQAVAMAATAVSLLAGAPPVVTYTLGALTAMALTTTHPAFAVVSPGIARTAGRLVALNAVTGWIFSVGIVIGPALCRPDPRGLDTRRGLCGRRRVRRPLGAPVSPAARPLSRAATRCG